MYVRIIDENGLFIEDGFIDELTELTIKTPCPQGFYLPKWDFDNEKWVEGGEKPISEAQEPSLQERLEALEELEIERMFNND